VIAQTDKAEGDGLCVGDAVVYAAHGVGLVVAREPKQVAGSECDCVVVDLAAGLRVTLSLADAGKRLRTVADERELDEVRRTLVADSSAHDKQWTRRIKESKAKLASGRPTELAEIVRDGSRFERLRGSQLSHAERRVYLQARDLLTREIASARGLQQYEAEAWIEGQLAPSGQDEG
jgi:CarD family transcriptional regulator